MKAFKEIFWIVLIMSGLNLFAQTNYYTEYEVQYEVSFSLDSLNLDKKQQEKVFLFTGSDYGVFLNYNEANAKHIREELERQSKAGYTDESSLVKYSEFPKQFYKNKPKDQVLVTAILGGKYVSYAEDKIPLFWEITEETKEFMGYQTQKATTSFGGRDYEAWFTLEIPISDGPYIFYGLPGLIVELYDTRRHYSFKMTSLQKLEQPITWVAPEALVMTKIKYLETLELHSKDYSLEAVIASSNVYISRAHSKVDASNIVAYDESGREISQEDYKRSLKKYLQSKNNPIELK